MQDVFNFFNSSMPVGHILAAAAAMFVAWKAGNSAFTGAKSALSNFAPGSLAAALMFTTGIGGIGYSIGDLVSRNDENPAVEQAAEVQWLSNDEILSLKDADDDNLRQLLQYAKDQNERQREFLADREKALALKAEAEKAKELTLMPTSVEDGAFAPIDFTLLGEDTKATVAEDTSLTEAAVSVDRPQLPIQGTIGLLGACIAVLISGVVTFIRQQA